MNRKLVLVPACLIAVAGTIALAQPAKDKPAKDTTKPATTTKAPAAAQPGDQPPLPPGWTEADMKACMDAGTPGPNHEHLAKAVGVWTGKTTMWMAPDTEPMKSECTSTVTSLMDGKFTRCEIAGDMPGMGPFLGSGTYGYDNVSKKFVSSWFDNCGTGIMNGTGELSSDGKVLTWQFNYNCPITKKPAVMREVETITGADTKKLEMFGKDPKTGKEFKMMEIAFTRKSGGASATGGTH